MNISAVVLLLALCSALNSVNVSSAQDGSFTTALMTALGTGGAAISLTTGTGPYTLPAAFMIIPNVEIHLILNNNQLIVASPLLVNGTFVVEGPGTLTCPATPPPMLFMVSLSPGVYSGVMEMRGKVTYASVKTVGVVLAGGSLTITDCNFNNNVSPIVAIASLNSMLTITKSTFNGNSGPAGIVAFNNPEAEPVAMGQFNIQECTFSSNSAVQGGTINLIPLTAPASTNTMKLTLRKSTFTDMFAYPVMAWYMAMEVTECTFNTEAVGVNANFTSFPVVVEDCTFNGGGVGVLGAISGPISVIGCKFFNGNIGVLAQGSGASSLTVSKCYLSGLRNSLPLPVASGITGYGVTTVDISDTTLEDMKGDIASIMLIQAGVAHLRNVTVQRVSTAMNGIMSLIASNVNLTECTFRNISSKDPIALQYGSQLIINTSLVENIDAWSGSVVSGEFNEFSTFHSTYRNINCTNQVFKIHTLLSPVSFGWDNFINVNASSLIFDELQGGSFESCNFLFTETSSEMTLYIISGKPVTMRNCYLTGSIKLLVDGESTEGVIPFTNITLRNVKTDGLLSSLQFTIEITDSVFENVAVLNSQRYLINLA